MQPRTPMRTMLTVLVVALVGTWLPAAEKPSGAKLYDTIHPLGDPWTPQQWAARGQWKQIPEDNTEDRFQGDAVVINDRLAIVFRTGSPGVSVYGLGPQGPTLRAVLGPALEGKPAIQSVRILENSLAEVVLEARLAVAGGKPVALRYALGMGQPFVLVEADVPGSWLAIRAPCRFLALPDFFADDIVVDAGEIPVDRAELPSEHLLARFLPGGDAIVTSVTGSQDQDARVRLAGSGAERRVETSEVSFGRSKRVWVAVLEGHGVWHQREVRRNEAGKVLPLDWKAPFAAQWRVDWRLADRLTSSWEMLVETRDGQFEKHGVFGSPATIPANRRRWATVLGWYEYPCWLSRQGQGFLQPLPKSRCEGPALVYPINRVKETPLSAFTVVDVLRATLGVGPCEYVLDVEGQGATMKGRATCATRDALKAIYAAREQRARRQEIEKILVEVVAFVTHIRGRIESYRDFANQTLQYLAAQREAHPELAGFLDEMEGLTRGVLAAYDRRKENIRTVQYVVDLTGKFRGEVLDDESPEAPKKCKAITEAIVQVGGNQDELVGECRQAVKILRQRAGLAMATDPRAASVAKEIRDRTQKVLRNPSTYEAPRH